MLTLAYWKIRGLAQPIRFLLEYVGADYVDKHYPTGPAPGFDKSEWRAARSTLGLHFPNLPYLLDGDLRLTESHAILRHLDRRFGLLPEEMSAQAMADNLACVVADLQRAYMDVCYSDDWQLRRDRYAAGLLADKLGALERFLVARGDEAWLVHEAPTYVDFLVYETLYQNRKLVPESVEARPRLLRFLDQVEGLPAIAAYLKSDRYLEGPINNRMARVLG